MLRIWSVLWRGGIWAARVWRLPLLLGLCWWNWDWRRSLHYLLLSVSLKFLTNKYQCCPEWRQGNYGQMVFKNEHWKRQLVDKSFANHWQQTALMASDIWFGIWDGNCRTRLLSGRDGQWLVWVLLVRLGWLLSCKETERREQSGIEHSLAMKIIADDCVYQFMVLIVQSVLLLRHPEILFSVLKRFDRSLQPFIFSTFL